jgi:hypothetical protein
MRSIYILLASSNPTGPENQPPFMILRISAFAASSRPARLSPEDTLPERSKAEEERPASMSLEKEEGSGV